MCPYSNQVLSFVFYFLFLMLKEMIFYSFYLLFPFCFEWMLADLEPCEAQWEGSWVDPAWAGQAWHFHYFQKSRKILSFRNLVQRYFFPTVVVFCFIGMVGGLICDECVCIECVIRQMFSFPDHSGCMSSMALMFHSQWYLSLTSSQMPFHPRKWNASFLAFSVPIFISTFFPGRRSYKLVT